MVMNKDVNEKLLVSSQIGDVNKVKELIGVGADTETVNHNDSTPLMLASAYGNIEIVKLLIDRCVDINRANLHGYTSLYLASAYKYSKIVHLLLEVGADINTSDKYKKESCLDSTCNGVWQEEYTQELIINKQPQNIKFFDENIGILPQLKEKYNEVIELSLMGLF